ncbi:Ig-like domain-containing protein [Candidatus Latescibacterota bacterium]
MLRLKVFISITIFLMMSYLAFAQGQTTITSISVTPEEETVQVGDEVQFTAAAYDAEEKPVIEAEFVWTVKEGIGTITETGMFTATSPGSGSVVAKVGNVSGEAAVTVTEQEAQVGESIKIFPPKASAVIGETVQFEAAVKDADGNLIEDAEVVWTVIDTNIGTIDEGLFTALAEGETEVTATSGELSEEAEVEVTKEEPELPEGVNTITILREFPDGKIRKFGTAVAEGDTVTLGGIPHPFNYMNGTRVYFTEGCIASDITITIKIPVIGNIDNENKTVEFEGDILTAVTFEVSVEGEVVSPFEFAVPLEVTIPYKKGLLTKLGINPEDLEMYFVGQKGELIREGISDCEVDSEGGTLTGGVSHFSDIAIAPKSAVTTAVEEVEMPGEFSLSQNHPNPFNPETTIIYMLPEALHVKLTIYNVLGQHVRTLVNGMKPVGSYSVVWDGTNDAGEKVTSGVYIYRIEAGNLTKYKKLMMMK